MWRRKVVRVKCHTCGRGSDDVGYAPYPNTIPGAAHGGRFICADCLYLEEHPEAARPGGHLDAAWKREQEEREEARYGHRSPADGLEPFKLASRS